MSEAILTIKHQILSGYLDTKPGQGPKELQEAIFKKIFDPITLWALKEHLDAVDKDRLDYYYKPIPVTDRTPLMEDYTNCRLVLLDEYYEVIRVVSVGLLTDWDAISNGVAYWLEKTEK